MRRDSREQGARGRVVHLTASYPPASGGIARYAHALARGRAPGSSTVLTIGETGRTGLAVEAGVRVVRVGRQGIVHSTPTGLLALGLGPRLRRLARSASLLHAHLPFPSLLAVAPLAAGGTPLVATFHNEIQGTLGVPGSVRRIHDLLLRRFLGRCAAILVTSADYAAASPTLREHVAKVRVVPYGLDADRFAAPAGAVTRADDLLLYVGGLRYYKGLDVLLHALSQVPSARLLVAGDGPERESLVRLAGHLGLSSRVRWLGHVPDAELPLLYSRAAALVLPSTGASESFGIVQLEAQSCGTPVVCSALPGLREVNLDGLTGLHARPGDAQDLARALNCMLSDHELRARLGRQAHRHVREKFAVARMLEGIEQVYGEVLARRRAARMRRLP